jgi:hypothetical protein
MRILIASTEKTGNTWLKHLLAHIYELPTPHIGQDFAEAEAAQLGSRWVTHQHFLPEGRLLAWAAANEVKIITMLRHPADLLVSLYHYCCNYASHYKDDRPVSVALQADAAQRQSSAAVPHHIVDGRLIRVLHDRLICDLNISISWMLSGWSRIVRYEDLLAQPAATLGHLCAKIAPAAQVRVREAINRCRLDSLRKTFEVDSRFFRRGLLGEWRTALPRDVRVSFGREPLRSQLAFLGYDVDVVHEEASPLSAASRSNIRESDEYFDNGIFFSPIFWRVLAGLDEQTRRGWEPAFRTTNDLSFFHWLNSPAEEDPFQQSAIPRITNLGAFIHGIRPDLRAAFPDIYQKNRLGYASWFLRYAGAAYELDRAFLTPVALSWISRPL